MPSERRGDDEARDPDHGWRLGSVGIHESVEAVVGSQRGIDPTRGLAVDIREIPEVVPPGFVRSWSPVSRAMRAQVARASPVRGVRGNSRRPNQGCLRRRRGRRTRANRRHGPLPVDAP